MPEIANNPKMDSINVRLLPELKAEAEKVFDYHGFTLPEAVTVFINHACDAGGFPFDLKDAPYSDPESMAALYESIDLMNDPNAKTFKTMDALIADLEADEDD